jgi:hypothetical protein
VLWSDSISPVEYTYVSENYLAFYLAYGGVMDFLNVGTLLHISESHYLQSEVNYNFDSVHPAVYILTFWHPIFFNFFSTPCM